MSDRAERFDPEKKVWEPVEIADITESMQWDEFRCNVCHAPAGVALGPQKRYFFSLVHCPGCGNAKGSQKVKINKFIQIDIDGMLRHVDRDDGPRNGGKTRDGGAKGGGEGEDDPEATLDRILEVDGTRIIRTAGGAYDAFCARRGSDFVDDFLNRTIDSFFLTGETLVKFRADWGTPVKLVVTRRCSPKDLSPKLEAEGYVVLRDVFSSQDSEAFYFLVRLGSESEDKKFRNKVFGGTRYERLPDGTMKAIEVKRDPRKKIVLLAEWEHVPHPYYRVYRATLNSCLYAFRN